MFITDAWRSDLEYRTTSFLREDTECNRAIFLFSNYKFYHTGDDEFLFGRRVGLIINRALAKHAQEVWAIPERILLLRLSFHKFQFILSGVKLSTRGDAEETAVILEISKTQLKKWRRIPIILLGDFNACIYPALDRSLIRRGVALASSEHRPDSIIVRKLVEAWGWKCPWRDYFPSSS